MKEEITKIIKELDGFVLCLGNFDDNILDKFEKNPKITEVEVWTNMNKISKKLKDKGSRKKVIYIQKLRKKYKKRNVNYIICEHENIKEYSKYFIRESIGVAKKEVYVILDKDDDIDIMKKRYHRYDTVVEEINTKDKIILKVDTSKAKNKKLKDFFYLISDTIYNGFDFIGEILSR